MHLGAAHRLQRRLLAGDHLDHAVAAQVHRGVAVDHRDDVAERRNIGATGGGRSEQRAHLRDAARGAHLVVEDVAGTAAAGEQIDLVGDARAGAVDQVDHRHAERRYARSMMRMIFSTVRAPHEPALTVESLAMRRDPAAVDRGRAGDHAVGRQPVGEHVGVTAVLDE